jgi:orotate phosphoribosyltransferase
VNPAEVQEVLERRSAVIKGHFRLSSGRHSDTYVQKFRVFEHPRLTQALGEAIAHRFANGFEVVAVPAVGAIPLGFATALAADSKLVIAERVDDELKLRRGFELGHGERTLIVEDVVTTGGSAHAVVDLVRGAGARPVGVGALLDRCDPARPADFGVRFEALLRLEVASWAEDDCPLCREGSPMEDPGSRRLPG